MARLSLEKWIRHELLNVMQAKAILFTVHCSTTWSRIHILNAIRNFERNENGNETILKFMKFISIMWMHRVYLLFMCYMFNIFGKHSDLHAAWVAFLMRWHLKHSNDRNINGFHWSRAMSMNISIIHTTILGLSTLNTLLKWVHFGLWSVYCFMRWKIREIFFYNSLIYLEKLKFNWTNYKMENVFFLFVSKYKTKSYQNVRLFMTSDELSNDAPIVFNFEIWKKRKKNGLKN